ncbi:unnamed protein product [Linum tenue]|uniref:MADS-box domain-containing protein n=1 Tax=Linum tenue TaxID=586396 RepID=A0AAV0JM04_9ROSI|nr:unnamed protein product [Linum tenue]
MFRTQSLERRRRTLKKKAEELSTLCGIDVAYVRFDHNGRVDTWPEDPNKVKSIILKYREVKSDEKPSAGVSPASSDGEIRGAAETNRELKLDGFSEEELLGSHRLVEEKLEKVRRRIANLEGNEKSRKKKRRRNYDLQTLNLIDLVGLPPPNSGTGHRCSSSSRTNSSLSCGSSMITGITSPDRSNSPISDPKSEWGALISL